MSDKLLPTYMQIISELLSREKIAHDLDFLPDGRVVICFREPDDPRPAAALLRSTGEEEDLRSIISRLDAVITELKQETA